VKRLLPFLLLGFVLVPNAVQAACPGTVNWTSAKGDGNWSTAGNWDTNAVPVSADDVCIGGAFSVTLNQTSASVHSLTVNGSLTIQGPTLSIAAASTINNLTLSGVGVINNAATLTLTGNFSWGSGTLGGTGTTTISAVTTATGASPAGYSTISGETVQNFSTITLTGKGATIAIGNANFTNNPGAEVAIQGDNGGIVDAGTGLSSFQNNGIIAQTVTTGISTISFNGSFGNNGPGSVSVNTGVLKIITGGTSFGEFTAGANAVLQFQGGPFNFGAVFTGGAQSSASFTGAGEITTSGIMEFDADTSIASAHFLVAGLPTGDTIRGPGMLTVSSPDFTWNSGNLSGPGTVVVPVATTLTIAAPGPHGLAASLNNAGKIVMTSVSASLSIQGSPTVSATLTNSGSFEMQGDVSVTGAGTASATFFNNKGTLTKTGGQALPLSSTIEFNGFFDNFGTVNVQAGNLSFLTPTGKSTGQFLVASGSLLNFVAGTWEIDTSTLNTGPEFNGDGTLEVQGGSLNLSSSLPVSAVVTVDTNTFVLGPGINVPACAITGAPHLAVKSTNFEWGALINGAMVGGTMCGTGTTDISAATTTTIVGSLLGQSVLDGRTVNNNGMAKLVAGVLDLQDGATWNNLGTFDIQTDGAAISGSSGPIATFNNYGTFQKSQGTGSSRLDFAGYFNNIGTTQVTAASTTLSFQNTGGTSTGIFRAAQASATISFGTAGNGTTFNVSGATPPAFGGPGTIVVGAGAHIILTGDTVFDVGTAFDLANAGEVKGAFKLTINSIFKWSNGGAIRGGTATLAGTSNTSIAGGVLGGAILDGEILENMGKVAVFGGSLNLDNAASWLNDLGSTLDLQTGGNIGTSTGSNADLINKGVLKKTGGTFSNPSSAIQFNGMLTNGTTGALAAEGGTLAIFTNSLLLGRVSAAGGSSGSINNIVNFKSGTTDTIGAGTSFEGLGFIEVGGTWSLSGQLTVEVNNFTLLFGGMINVTGDTLTINSTNFTWDAGGTIGGSGNVTLSEETTTTFGFVCLGCGPVILNGLGLSNQGHADGVITGLYLQNGAIWTNMIGSQFDTVRADSPTPDSSAIIGTGTAQFINQGTFIGHSDKSIDITINVPGGFTNSGTVTLEGTGTVLMTGTPYTQTAGSTSIVGTLEDDLNFLLQGGSLYGGTLYLSGRGSSLIDERGEIQGSITTTLQVIGNIVLSGVSKVNLPFDAPAMVNVTGSAALAGTLNLTLLQGFTPTPGLSFPVITAGSITGTFSGTNTVSSNGQIVTRQSSASTITAATGQNAQIPRPPANAPAARSAAAPPGGNCVAQVAYTATIVSVQFVFSGGPSSISVSVSPAIATVGTSGMQQFNPTLLGGCGSAVSWSVQEGAAGGFVSSTGLYSAPATPGTFHVVVTSAEDSTKSATATVTVKPVLVSVNPPSVTLQLSGSKQFSAMVSFATVPDVTWSIQEGASGGMITPDGLYTSPATARTVHVVATSVADTSKNAVATVTVSGSAPVTILPGHAVLLTGGTQNFSANQNVTWKVLELAAGGAITAAGQYTAPQSTGTFHVVATSTADTTQSAQAQVSVVSSLQPAPFIQSLSPTATAPGGTDLTLTVDGVGFQSGSKVNWNKTALATTFVSAVQLTADVPAALTVAGTVGWVTVTNPAPGGGASNLLFFPVTNGSAAAQFAASHFTGGNAPSNGVVADFNGDGKLDLALVNSLAKPETAAILLGNGDGTFSAAQAFDVGQGPSSIAVGDFDGDGKLDLAVTNLTDDTVSVLLGNGDGTFQTQQVNTTGAAPMAVAVGDFNGDGKLDLAVANSTDNTISVLFGNGDGTFQTAQSFSTGKQPRALAVGDFNGDGKLDLAVANSTDNTISVLFGNGDGTFQTQQTYSTGVSPSAVAVGDFNGNGQLDLAVTNLTDNTVSIFVNSGNGTFAPQQTFATGVGPTSVSVADLNGDGNLDLAVANVTDGSTSVLIGVGDGTFQPLIAYPDAVQASVAIGDFTATGRLGFAVAESTAQQAAIFIQGPAFSPPSLAFGNQLAGSTSSAQTITVTNNTGAPLEVDGISITPATISDFNETDTCSANVAVGGKCTISITFSPTTTGARIAVVNIPGNWPGTPQLVSLAGTGIVAGAPAAIVASGGTPQSAVINTAFTSPLQATVTDSNMNPVPNVTVTFTAPTSGPSGTFAGGVNTAMTNGSGVASITFTANGTVGGPYNVTAMAGMIGPASFSLTNLAILPATITASAGTPQSAPIKTAFGAAVQATVKDSDGNPVPNVAVAFTAPSSGASGTFAGGMISMQANTDANGVATSAAFTANSTAGGPYNVTAKVGSVGPANFALTNVDFVLTQDATTSGTIQVTAGTPAMIKLDVGTTPTNALLPVSVTFACNTPLPTGTSCSFVPPSLAAGSPSGSSTTLTFHSTSSTGVMSAIPPMDGRDTRVLDLVWLAVAALLTILGIFAANRQRRAPALRRWPAYLTLVLLTITVVSLISCTSAKSGGGGGSSANATPKGPASFSVTATSGADSQPIVININVN
jgi:hypothetical protein